MKYLKSELGRDDIARLEGPVVLEFGANGCGFCARAQPAIAAALAQHRSVRLLKIEDGKGRPLGRSFGVKLWPTLIFLRDGNEVVRLVRPAASGAITRALAEIDPVQH